MINCIKPSLYCSKKKHSNANVRYCRRGNPTDNIRFAGPPECDVLIPSTSTLIIELQSIYILVESDTGFGFASIHSHMALSPNSPIQNQNFRVDL